MIVDPKDEIQNPPQFDHDPYGDITYRSELNLYYGRAETSYPHRGTLGADRRAGSWILR